MGREHEAPFFISTASKDGDCLKLVIASLSFIFVLLSFLVEARSSESVAPAALTVPEIGVKVRLYAAQKNLRIEGLAVRYQSSAPDFQSVAIPQQRHFEVRVLKKDGKSFWGLKSPSSPVEKLLTDPEVLIRGEQLRIAGRSVPGQILLQKTPRGEIDVIGLLPLDDYVVGVLASEMPLSWPLETLKAQAIAARSYALAVVEERKKQRFHLESNVMDQVFRHIVEGEKNHPLVQKAVQAVTETKGMKLYMPKSPQVLKAFFHSDCGGRTATAKSVWNSSINAGVTEDPSCPTSPTAKWSLNISRAEMASRLKLPGFSSISLIRDTLQGRIQAVKVALLDSTEKIFPANEFRRLLGFQELKSALFEVKEEGEGLAFEGKGFGHGVGLCQWGSRHLGTKGYTFKQILKHYYPLAELRLN